MPVHGHVATSRLGRCPVRPVRRPFRDISGFTFMLDSGAMSWRSHKQELITLSMVEAEYVVAMYAAKECIWLCHLLHQCYARCVADHALAYKGRLSA